MQNTKIFDDFDMVVSLTEKTINDQLTHLTRLGVIDSQLILTRVFDHKTLDYTYTRLTSADQIPANHAFLNVTLLVPKIAISETGSNVSFILQFKTGTLGVSMDGEIEPVDFHATDGWQYALMVRMDLATLAKEDIAAHKGIPQNVKDQLTKFTESMFTVNSLFMDFQSIDLLNFDQSKSNAGSTGDVGLEHLRDFMQFYIRDLMRTGNPYILGYSIVPPIPDNTPAQLKVPEALRPVGTTYTMYFDAVHNELSNLNFCLVTAGGHKTITTQPGNLDANWITPADQCDAKAIWGHGALVEPLILQPFFDHYAASFYAQIKDNLSVNQGNTYAQAKSSDGTKTSFVISDGSNGDSDNKYNNKFTVEIVNSGTCTTLTLSGHADVYKKATKEPAEAWATGSVDWNGSIVITTTVTDGVPTLAFTKTFNVSNNSQDSHLNDWGKALDWMGKIVRGVLDAFTGFTMDFLGKIIDDAMTLSMPGLSDVSDVFTHMDSMVRATIVLPGGDVFYFKSPATDAELNLHIPLTYKAQSTAPAARAARELASNGVPA